MTESKDKEEIINNMEDMLLENELMESNELYGKYYKETKKSATYKRDGKKFETNNFKKWLGDLRKDKLRKKIRKKYRNIPFNDSTIVLKDDGVYNVNISINYKGEPEMEEELILDGKLDILFKTTDNLNVDRYTFYFHNHKYFTCSKQDVLRKLKNYIYGGRRGRDIINRVFNYIGDKLENNKYKDEYILGFRNGWKLPQLEQKHKYLIIRYTDYQKQAYRNATNIIKNYSEREKQRIENKFSKLIRITQIDPKKLSIIIGWAVASIFRLTILEKINIFHILYLVGPRGTGKSPIEKLFCIHLYGLFDKMLPSNTIESKSRTEDHMSKSGFPIVIPEIHSIRNSNEILSLFKHHATGGQNFERKKSASELEFNVPEPAPICLDSNHILDTFRDAAANSKIITVNLKKKIKKDQDWIDLKNKLKKRKLFSFIYDVTKNWKNDDVFERLDNLEQDITEDVNELGLDYDKFKTEYPRIVDAYKIVLFGLNIFNEAFGINIFELNFKFFELSGFRKIDILEELFSARKIIPSNLRDQFYNFCVQARDYQESKLDHNGNIIPINNPKYLTCKLKKHKNGFHHVFTQDNLRDFNEYTRKSHDLTSLAQELKDMLDDREDIVYANCRPFENSKRMRVLLINNEWLSNVG